MTGIGVGRPKDNKKGTRGTADFTEIALEGKTKSVIRYEPVHIQHYLLPHDRTFENNKNSSFNMPLQFLPPSFATLSYFSVLSISSLTIVENCAGRYRSQLIIS